LAGLAGADGAWPLRLTQVEAPSQRRVTVETGEDPRALGQVVEGPYVFRVRQGGAVSEHGRVRRADNLPLTERYRGAIGAGLAVVLVGLAIWALLLLRKPADPAPPEGKEGG
jgi:hypothetical protein